EGVSPIRVRSGDQRQRCAPHRICNRRRGSRPPSGVLTNRGFLGAHTGLRASAEAAKTLLIGTAPGIGSDCHSEGLVHSTVHKVQPGSGGGNGRESASARTPRYGGPG